MKSEIKLLKQPDGWMAIHCGPLGAEVMELFGTNTLPTAFTAQADELTVLQAIQHLNPGVTVTVAGR